METVRSYIESQRTSEHKRKYTKSDDTSNQVNMMAELPDHFGLSCYAQVKNTDTGITYNLPLYAANTYFQRCYVPNGQLHHLIRSVPT